MAQERPHVLGIQETRIAAPSTTNGGGQKDSAAPSYVDVVKSLLPDYDSICEPARFSFDEHHLEHKVNSPTNCDACEASLGLGWNRNRFLFE